MTMDQPIEQVICTIAGLDRDSCIARLRAVQQPRLDFTDEFLREQTLDQVRHLLLAACIQAQRSRR